MTEKRFGYNELIFLDGAVIDNLTNEHLDEDGVINTLNKLNDENEELKQYNKDLKEGLKDAEKRIEVQKWQLQVYREKEADLKQRLFEAKRDYLMETSDISDALYIDEEMEQLRKEVYDI